MEATILQNTDDQLAKAMVYERVRLAYARSRALVTGGWLLRDGPVEVWACPFMDLFNGLISPNWPEEAGEDLWRRALALYRQTGHGMFVSFGPSSRSHSLQQRVQRDGFRRCSSMPFMHLDLNKLREHPSLHDVRIERIRDLSFFENHEHPWLGAVGSPYRRSKMRFLREYGDGKTPRLWQFLAFHQRKIVGAATLFAHGDEVAIFDVVVVQSCRRRGIGTRLTYEACEFARSVGMRRAGLSSSSKGIGMYRKLGFTDAGYYSDFFLSREGLAGIRI